MNATRILPDLQCSLMCEEVRQEVTGNFILIGVINFIRVPQLPIVASRLAMFNRWTAGLGQFIESVRLIAPDQTTVLRKGEVKFALQDANLHATNVTVFSQVEFKNPGTYYIEVLVDDVMKLRYPVPVILAPPPSQNPQAVGTGSGCTVTAAELQRSTTLAATLLAHATNGNNSVWHCAPIDSSSKPSTQTRLLFRLWAINLLVNRF